MLGQLYRQVDDSTFIFFRGTSSACAINLSSCGFISNNVSNSCQTDGGQNLKFKQKNPFISGSENILSLYYLKPPNFCQIDSFVRRPCLHVAINNFVVEVCKSSRAFSGE
jgi:hypothetical protein